MDPILAPLTTLGLPGVIIAVLIYWLWRTQAELGAERKARVEDAQNYTTLALKLQGEVHASIDRLEKISELQRRQPRG